MAILDIFKKKKEKKEKEKFEVEPRETSETQPRQFQSSIILKTVHITEKAGDLTEKNQYIFRVYPKANKINVRKVVEDIFKVNVTSVRIINIPKKKKRLGKISGWRKGYKKAIVGIKKGQKMDLLHR